MSEITAKQKAKIKRAIKSLNDAILEIRGDHPEANYYLEDSGNLHIMPRDAHDDDTGRDRQDESMLLLNLYFSSGGAW